MQFCNILTMWTLGIKQKEKSWNKQYFDKKPNFIPTNHVLKQHTCLKSSKSCWKVESANFWESHRSGVGSKCWSRISSFFVCVIFLFNLYKEIKWNLMLPKCPGLTALETEALWLWTWTLCQNLCWNVFSYCYDPTSSWWETH